MTKDKSRLRGSGCCSSNEPFDEGVVPPLSGGDDAEIVPGKALVSRMVIRPRRELGSGVLEGRSERDVSPKMGRREKEHGIR